jgi:hypothetical protein
MSRDSKRKGGSAKEWAIENERNGKGVCKIYYLIAGGESY